MSAMAIAMIWIVLAALCWRVIEGLWSMAHRYLMPSAVAAILVLGASITLLCGSVGCMILAVHAMGGR